MLQKLSKIYPLPLELIPLFLLILVIYLTLANYPALPDRIPTHFNWQGFPDGWGSKNELFIFPGLSLFVYALITGISLAMVVASNPLSLINLPSGLKKSLPTEQAEKLRVFLVRSIFALKVLVLGLDVYLLYSNIEVAFQRVTGIGEYWPLIFILVILLLVSLMVFRSFRIALSHG